LDDDDRLLERESMSHSDAESDYCDVYLPWGPQWQAARVLRMLELRDRAAMFSQKKIQHRHTFVSGIDNIISGKSLVRTQLRAECVCVCVVSPRA
jgi:hypothetical protein